MDSSLNNSDNQQSQLIDLPHEVQWHLIEYLELEDLRSFSETSLEGNALASSFLKQQFDGACRIAVAAPQQENSNSSNNNNNRHYRLAGTECIHRLARLDSNAASRLLLSPEERSHHHHLQHPHGGGGSNPPGAPPSSVAPRQALRQLLSDGLAAVHEQRRQAARVLWSHAGCGAVLVTAMAGRLFYRTACERLGWAVAVPEKGDSDQQHVQVADLYEWHDLSRLSVGILFAVTVFVGVSKQQQRRRDRIAKQQQETEAAAAAVGNSNKSNNSMKRSLSVAGDLAAAVAPPLHRSRSTESLLLGAGGGLPLSVSAPNLHHLLLNYDYESNELRSSSSPPLPSSSRAAEDESEETLWNVREDESATKRKDPLRHRFAAPSRRSGSRPSRTSSSRPHKKRRFNETEPAAVERARPTGCVGAFQRATADAKTQAACIIKERRKQAFEELPSDDERANLSTALIDACTDDASLGAVRIIARRLPLDEFYIGSDNTESCAVHTAAFHGACHVLHFLCRGVDCSWTENKDDDDDGGLCNVNLRDANGWTALHFAAGANCPEAIRVLAEYGAALDTEALNGYTPLQWALRLQNRRAADELRRLLAEEKQMSKHHFWQRILPAWLAGRAPTAPTSNHDDANHGS